MRIRVRYKCPFCEKGRARVINTRPNTLGVYRRRECYACGRRFSTQEKLIPIKKNHNI